MLIRAWADGPLAAAAFLVGFYACLVGAKMLLAVIAGRSGGRLRGGAYRAVMVVLGALLLLFAVRLAGEGLRLLGVLPS
jgi:threonine/homoserine/homoserine lactone efflux protein